MKALKIVLTISLVLFLAHSAFSFNEKYDEHRAAVTAASLPMVSDTMEGMSFAEIEKKAIEKFLFICVLLVGLICLAHKIDRHLIVKKAIRRNTNTDGFIESGKLIQALNVKKQKNAYRGNQVLPGNRLLPFQTITP